MFEDMQVAFSPVLRIGQKVSEKSQLKIAFMKHPKM